TVLRDALPELSAVHAGIRIQPLEVEPARASTIRQTYDMDHRVSASPDVHDAGREGAVVSEVALSLNYQCLTGLGCVRRKAAGILDAVTHGPLRRHRLNHNRAVVTTSGRRSGGLGPARGRPARPEGRGRCCGRRASRHGDSQGDIAGTFDRW